MSENLIYLKPGEVYKISKALVNLGQELIILTSKWDNFLKQFKCEVKTFPPNATILRWEELGLLDTVKVDILVEKTENIKIAKENNEHKEYCTFVKGIGGGLYYVKLLGHGNTIFDFVVSNLYELFKKREHIMQFPHHSSFLEMFEDSLNYSNRLEVSFSHKRKEEEVEFHLSLGEFKGNRKNYALILATDIRSGSGTIVVQSFTKRPVKIFGSFP